MVENVRVRWEVSNSTFGNLLDFTSLDTVKLVFPSVPVVISASANILPQSTPYGQGIWYALRSGVGTDVFVQVSNTTSGSGSDDFSVELEFYEQYQSNYFATFFGSSGRYPVSIVRGGNSVVVIRFFMQVGTSMTLPLTIRAKVRHGENVITQFDLLGHALFLRD